MVVALTFTTSFQTVEGGRHPAAYGTFAKQAQVYGAYVWAYLVLTAALVVLLRTPDRSAAATVAASSPEGPPPLRKSCA